MAFTLGQHTSSAPAGFQGTLAYVSNITSGNLLIAVSTIFSASGVVSTPWANTGTAGAQTWNTLLTNPYQSTSNASTTQMWWAIASGTGSCSCTVTWTPISTGGEMYISEWSGTSISASLAQDGTGQTHDSSVGGNLATINVPTIATTYANDLVFGYVSSANAGTVQSPYVQVDTQSGDEWFYQADVGVNTYPTGVNGYVKQTSATYACVMAALGIPSSTLSVGVTSDSVGSGESTLAPFPTPIRIIN